MDQATPMPCGGRVRERVAEPRYRPIRDYAAIGDCHGPALVSRDGSIDWCTLRRFDADPVFCRILDAGRGGFRSIRPLGEYRAARSYLEDPLRPGVPGPPHRGAGAVAIVGEI
jgi:hypothetical protein